MWSLRFTSLWLGCGGLRVWLEGNGEEDMSGMQERGEVCVSALVMGRGECMLAMGMDSMASNCYEDMEV